MPANRITPAQLFALAVIWSAVAYGVVMTGGDRPTRTLSYKEREGPASEGRGRVRCYGVSDPALQLPG